MGGGTPVSSPACPECGAGLPAAAKFCPECGTPVSQAVGRESRRTVTLLFTDVTGSTAIGEQLDPETYRDVMGRYFEIARAAIERHGGTVEKFVGDAVLAVFGIPELREDDALRAVRAARELNDELDDLSEQVLAELGVRLAIRTGVNTGAVVAGSARAGGSFATGDAVNTAARLEQAAAPGEILLGATTYALVRDAVEAETVAPVKAKGKAEPVPAYRLVSVLDTDRGRRRRDDVKLVGREQEVRALRDALEHTVSTGRSHLVTVVGPAGIGKSRLVKDFLADIGDGADVARGRCLSYGQGITYWPLAQALRDALHLAGTASDEVTRHALDRAMGDAADREEVVELLMPLVGRSGSPGGSEQTFWSVRRLLEELASRRPLVLSVDDLHWAEPTLLELLRSVRAEMAHLPLLLLCQARPELLEQTPDWGSGAGQTMTLGLDPLSPDETAASLDGLLAGPPPDGLADEVARWSGGNPLFVEEIVAHLVESRLLQRDSRGRWQLAGPLERPGLPPTVTALLASRLDRLPPAERDVLERASVIGPEFDLAEVRTLVEPETAPGLPGLLAALSRHDLVRRVGSLDGDAWAFKHVLVRDAAYDAMAKSRRAELHEAFADSLEPGDEAGGETGFVAHHLEQAARLRRELGVRGPRAEALVDRAVRTLLVAADQARDGERHSEGLAYLRRALGLHPIASAVRRRILARLAFRQYEQYQFDLCGEALSSFEAELDDTADQVDGLFLTTMQGVHALGTGRAIDPVEVSAAAQRLIDAGRASGNDGAVLVGLQVTLLCSGFLCRWQDNAELLDEVIRIGSPFDVWQAVVLRGIGVMSGDAPIGDCADVIRHLATIVGHTDRQELRELMVDAMVAAAHGSPDAGDLVAAEVTRREELAAAGREVFQVSPFMMHAYRMLRDLDNAIADAQRMNDALRVFGDMAHAATHILTQALLMLERGDAARTVLPLVEEAVPFVSPYDAAAVSPLAACRALLAVRAHDHEPATALAVEALRVVDDTQDVWLRADLRRWLSEVPRATGDLALESRLLHEAAEMYARKEIRSYDAEIGARLAELGRQEA
jgi:class 3 adenylate cyclase